MRERQSEREREKQSESVRRVRVRMAGICLGVVPRCRGGFRVRVR